MSRRFLRLPRGAAGWRLAILGILALALAGVRLAFYGVSTSYGPPASSGHGGGMPAGLRPDERIMERDGRELLWGGENPDQHFDVTRFTLDPNQLNYGLGRENFPALIEPEFAPAEEAESWEPLTAETRVLAARVGHEVHVYPLGLMRRHEVVNDEIGGVPVFAAYCVLADLGAVYKRKIGGHTLTFGVSGYTYAEPDVWDGQQAFVLWDRDTESLWWPTIGKAVSGPLIDAPLPLLDRARWSQTTWDKVKEAHADAEVLVLRPNQGMEPPEDWPRLSGQALKDVRAATEADVAPRWGDNSNLTTYAPSDASPEKP